MNVNGKKICPRCKKREISRNGYCIECCNEIDRQTLEYMSSENTASRAAALERLLRYCQENDIAGIAKKLNLNEGK